MKPKLSIIIPCFNCRATLTQAVESCFKQGLNKDDFEIILVDDASTDDTGNVMESLLNKFDNIKLHFHTVNLGGGATRNTAVKNTNSDVIFCLDSDDILPPNTLDKMLSYLNEKKCDGIGLHYSTKFVGSNQNDVDVINEFSYSGDIIPVDSLLEQNGVLCSLYSVFMFTKSAFIKAGGYPDSHGFDTQGFAWRFLTSNLVAYTCPNTNYLHRVKFHESYYLREANSGKVNFNWQKVLSEHLPLFTDEAQDFIKKFPCENFTKNLWLEFVSLPNIFRDNYLDIIRDGYKRTDIEQNTATAIKRNSLHGIYLRLMNRIKS